MADTSNDPEEVTVEDVDEDEVVEQAEEEDPPRGNNVVMLR